MIVLILVLSVLLIIVNLVPKVFVTFVKMDLNCINKLLIVLMLMEEFSELTILM